jgi:glycosyltransferase involved in cell wall biosynthesis
MHVAFDAHMVGERQTGNETYALNLVQALLSKASNSLTGGPSPPAGGSAEEQRLSAESPGERVTFSLLATEPQRLQKALGWHGTSHPESPDLAQIVALRPGNPLWRIPLVMPAMAARYQVDLLHVTYHAPPLASCPAVVSVHDISFEHYPQFFSPRDLLVLKTLVPLSARRAARVMTGSRHAKDEIVARYGISPDKVVVAYMAAGPQFQPVTQLEALAAVRRRYGIGSGPFILALGNLQPRKNIHRLVQAFAPVVRERQAKGSRASRVPYSGAKPAAQKGIGGSEGTHPKMDQVKLVIAGQAQWRESEIVRAVAEAGVEESVVFAGYVADADLPALYSAATLFVYPSLYEGFGLPPLEAMACGTPVLCSNTTSLPEVVGDAALAVDPTEVHSLTQAMVTVLGHPGLQADLRDRGLARAAQFSWQRCADETWAVYQEVYRRK